MTSYSFNSAVLSAAKTGNPPVSSSSVTLSSGGVNTITLSTNVVGLVFNVENTLVGGGLISFDVQGSTFKIDKAYHNKVMALVKVPLANVETYSTFTFLSSLSAPASLSSTSMVSTPSTRRKHLLGYR